MVLRNRDDEPLDGQGTDEGLLAGLLLHGWCSRVVAGHAGRAAVSWVLDTTAGLAGHRHDLIPSGQQAPDWIRQVPTEARARQPSGKDSARAVRDATWMSGVGRHT